MEKTSNKRDSAPMVAAKTLIIIFLDRIKSSELEPFIVSLLEAKIVLLISIKGVIKTACIILEEGFKQ